MEIGKQIKKYRTELRLSQDELADKIFVTRQTISNWENDKNYPDIKSLVMLSNLFGVSLDILVKGDLEKMKEEIQNDDMGAFRKQSNIFAVLMLALIIVPIPLTKFMGFWGLGIYVLLFVITMVYAFKIEKYKKSHDIQTYKEIAAFLEGRRLDEIEKQREIKKRPYRWIIAGTFSAVITAAVAIIMIYILG